MPIQAPTAATAATTRAAYVPLVDLPKETSGSELVSSLRGRGYNTLIVPLMEEGEFHHRRKGRGAKSRLAGPLADALTAAFSQKRTSVWLSLDPLAAGRRGSGQVGRFADDHREWLMRNTGGRLLPVGNENKDPLFSWMNVLYRRFLGDHLVAMVEAYPVTAIVVDLRRYPGMSQQHDRWYCCSFQSQYRAEDALGMGFERLLYDGTQADIARWQKWVLSELQVFLSNLAARIRTTRNDISLKLLVPPVISGDPRDAPWLKSAADGIADELIVHVGEAPIDLPSMIASIDDITGRRVPIVPAWSNEKQLAEGTENFLSAPSPGYLVMAPELEQEPRMPDVALRWDVGGAMEDHPQLAALALARAMASELEVESEFGRRYSMLAEQIERLEPEYNQLSLIQEQSVTLHSALHLDSGNILTEKPWLLRDADLLIRLLNLVKLQPNVV